MSDISNELQQSVLDAYHKETPLNIIGGNSKSWYGRTPIGEPLQVAKHQGIINYQPTELIITARAGTKLSTIADALDEHEQRLPFDPPYFGENATLGGTIACNFSGPRRPYVGSARDFMLGCHIINGKGEILKFGGEVMKNVAGFDVSRLMAGSLGTLGILLDISLKILPHRQAEQTITLAGNHADAINIMNRWAGTPLPVTAMASDGEHIYFRICGTESSVAMSMQQIVGDKSGEIYADGLNFWKDVREHTLPFFKDDKPLYRLSVPSSASFKCLNEGSEQDWFIDWGGAQRWLKSELPFATIQQIAKDMDGYATLFRGGDHQKEVFAPLTPPLMQLHQRLKQAFDPKNILNPGRMYKLNSGDL